MGKGARELSHKGHYTHVEWFANHFRLTIGSVAGEGVDEHLAIGVEDLRLGDEADVFVFGVDHGQVPGLGVVEDVHDLLHGHVVDNLGGGGNHEARDAETLIELGAEHDVADVVHQDEA